MHKNISALQYCSNTDNIKMRWCLVSTSFKLKTCLNAAQTFHVHCYKEGTFPTNFKY